LENLKITNLYQVFEYIFKIPKNSQMLQIRFLDLCLLTEGLSLAEVNNTTLELVNSHLKLLTPKEKKDIFIHHSYTNYYGPASQHNKRAMQV